MGLVHLSDNQSQCLRVVYNERVADRGIAASAWAVGDSNDNASADNVNGSYKNELIHTRTWTDVVEVDIATFGGWVGGMGRGFTKVWVTAPRRGLNRHFG